MLARSLAAKGIYLAGLLLDCKPSKLRSVQFLAFRVGFLLGWARVLCNLEDVYTKSGGSVLPLLTGNVGVLTTTLTTYAWRLHLQSVGVGHAIRPGCRVGVDILALLRQVALNRGWSLVWSLGPVVDVQLKSYVEDIACNTPVRVALSWPRNHVTLDVRGETL